MANRSIKQTILMSLVLAAVPMVASAITPIVVKTVPWIPASPATPHYAWDGKAITLKGTSNIQDAGSNTIMFDWNPGDGSGPGGHCTGVVTNMFVIECAHTYTYANGATVGNVFSATLTVWDSATGTEPPGGTATNYAIGNYYTQIYAGPSVTAGNPSGATPNLPVEVNAAIDSGLWFMHKTMTRTAASTSAGGVLSVVITNPGQDYEMRYSQSYGNQGYCCYSISFTATGAGNTGSGASISGTIDTNSASPTYGQVVSVSVDAPGSGYVAPVAITATDGYCSYKTTYPQYYEGPCGANFAGTSSVTVATSATLGTWFGGSPIGKTATNCTAFEVSGHLEGGPVSDPYTDDVKDCIAAVEGTLQTTSVGGTKTNSHGSFTTDQNNNGIGVHEVDGAGEDQYQSGMVLDVFTASGTPNKAVGYGILASLGHPPGGAAGTYTYKDAVVDMVDYNTYCQADLASAGATTEGSWVYGCRPSYGDNSVAQWVAIGMISGARDFGASIPVPTRQANQDWLAYSQSAGFGGSGYFGYSSTSPIWGPYAVTPAGMVQMAMSGIGRSPTATCCVPANNSSATPWDWAETYERDNFDNTQNYDATHDMKDYYYGLFSFTKSMLLHDNSGTGLVTTPIQMLRSLDNAAMAPIDWYSAQDSHWGGTDSSNGVARTLVSGSVAGALPAGDGGTTNVAGQNSDGSWSGHDYGGYTSDFNTGWAIIMLNHTVTQLVPVACATSPSGTNNTPIQLNGQCSFDQDPNKQIVSWDWDVSGSAGTTFSVHGVNPFHTFVLPVGQSLPYQFPVRLRVTDNGNPAATADYVFNVTLNAGNGDFPPVANAGGPYNFCPNLTPWKLDGSLTTQQPNNTISSYGWDFSDNCVNGVNYGDSSQVQPRVDTGAPNMFGFAPGSYCVKLRVVNNQNESSVASSTVNIYTSSDLHCSNCVQQPTGKAKNASPGSPGDAQLYWLDTNTAAFPVDHYNIYRSSTATFNTQVQIAGANGVYPAVPAPAVKGSQMLFIDGTAATAATYYYRISPATINDVNTCSSPVTVQVVVKASRGSQPQ